MISWTLWTSSRCLSKAINLSQPILSIIQLPTHHVATSCKHIVLSPFLFPSHNHYQGYSLPAPVFFTSSLTKLSPNFPSILNSFTKEIKNPENGTSISLVTRLTCTAWMKSKLVMRSERNQTPQITYCMTAYISAFRIFKINLKWQK